MRENKKNILITGGAGYIGINLISFFLNKNYKIYVIDNLSTSRSIHKKIKKLINFEKIDLTKENKVKKNEKIYINITALDKITANTSTIRLAIGEKKFFGALEIKALKCQLSEQGEFIDMVAYLQVKDLSSKDNNQVFLFNGWTFASSPTLQSIDHPIYDLWITSCENI